jgi:hypothetical protein
LLVAKTNFGVTLGGFTPIKWQAGEKEQGTVQVENGIFLFYYKDDEEIKFCNQKNNKSLIIYSTERSILGFLDGIHVTSDPNGRSWAAV